MENQEELSEQEKYALFANVPYLINEGVPVNIIERDLKQFNLDYKIDDELTDKISSTLVGKDDVVHSVRGTDIHSFEDLVSDLGIITSNPAAIKLLNTLIAGTSGLSILRDRSSDEGTSFVIKYLLDTPSAHEKYGEKITKYKNLLAEWEAKAIKEQKFSNIKRFSGFTVATYLMNKLRKLTTDPIRINPEREKLEKIKNKYPGKSISLAGHSLGSVVNILGRETNFKSVTFNPAPQEQNEILEPHPESKIYRTKYDPVSFFLSKFDQEKIVTIPQKHYEPHSLSNFLPEKRIIRKEIKQEKQPKKEILKLEKDAFFDYCKFYPNDVRCKNIIYT